jgi:hypothetical protein
MTRDCADIGQGGGRRDSSSNVHIVKSVEKEIPRKVHVPQQPTGMMNCTWGGG